MTLIATHASLIRHALAVLGIRAHVRCEVDRIDVEVVGGQVEMTAALAVAEVRRGRFALLVKEV